MNKSPLIVAILGAILLVLQQAIGQPVIDWKVIGLAGLIAVAGIVSTYLKGKGVSLLGALGTVIYTFVQVWQTGHFNWNEFFLTAAIAVITLFTQSAVVDDDDN